MVFAADPVPRELTFWLLTTLPILAIVLVAAAFIIRMVGQWARSPDQAAASTGGLLAQFRLMYEQGECTREEYERVRSRLGKRLRQELDLPTEGRRPSSEEPGPEGPTPTEGPTA